MPCRTAAGLRQGSVTSATAGRLLSHRRANNEPGLNSIRDSIRRQGLTRQADQRGVGLSCAYIAVRWCMFKHNFDGGEDTVVDAQRDPDAYVKDPAKLGRTQFRCCSDSKIQDARGLIQYLPWPKGHKPL